jgi:hypothetical protein
MCLGCNGEGGIVSTVMSALVAGIHVFLAAFHEKDVDGRDKPGHDCGEMVRYERNMLLVPRSNAVRF